MTFHMLDSMDIIKTILLNQLRYQSSSEILTTCLTGEFTLLYFNYITGFLHICLMLTYCKHILN